MTAPTAIADLVSRFDRNRDSSRSPAYNEEQLRAEFLNPLFLLSDFEEFTVYAIMASREEGRSR